MLERFLESVYLRFSPFSMLPIVIFLLMYLKECDILNLSRNVTARNRLYEVTTCILNILIKKWEFIHTMYDRVLNRMRRLIVKRQYVVSAHAYDEMAADDLAIWDVESIILTGKIVERQKDKTTSENKYRLRGKTLGGSVVEVIVKFGITGKLVVITVYAL